jgi:hypothetical protein
MDEVSTLCENLQFDNELLTAHCIQLDWVEMPVSEQEKSNEAIENNEDEDE